MTVLMRGSHSTCVRCCESICASRQLFSHAIQIICRWNASNCQNDICLVGTPFSMSWRWESFK
jgi:hypothetical protein